MQGDVRHRDAVSPEHHGELVGARALGQDLRVTGVLDAGSAQTLLVKRARDDPVRRAGHRQVNGAAEEVVGRAAGLRADASWLNAIERRRSGQKAWNDRRRWLSLARLLD